MATHRCAGAGPPGIPATVLTRWQLLMIGSFLLSALLGTPRASGADGRPGSLTTVAGFGINQRLVDLNFVSPGLMAADSAGNVYFPDTGNHVVYFRDLWNIIDVIAGNGLPGFSGDGGAPANARLNHPKAVATYGSNLTADPEVAPGSLDPNAALYIADTGNHRIRKVSVSPVGSLVISTIAGDGSAQSKGDGGPALSAGFISPEGLAVDAQGNLYIADRLAHRIRRVAPNGTITTVAGTGESGFSGDGGPATQARLNEPTALFAAEDGALYFSDTMNNRVRVLRPDGTVATVIGGGMQVDDGAAGPDTAIVHPFGIARNHAGILFFTDGARVRGDFSGSSLLLTEDLFDTPSLSSRLLTRATPFAQYLYAQLTPATRQAVDTYNGVDFPPDALVSGLLADLNALIQGPNLYTPDRFAGVDLSQRAKDRIAANPQGVELQRLNRLLLDEAFPRELIRSLMDGRIHTVAGTGQYGWSGDNGLSVEATFRRPYGLAVPGIESLLITDDEQRRIRGVNGLDVTNNYITSSLGDKIWDDTPGRSAKLTLPAAVAPAPDGRALIADFGNRRIRLLAPPCRPRTANDPPYLYTVAGNGVPPFPSTEPCANLSYNAKTFLPPADGVKAVEADLAPPTGVAGQVGGPWYFSEGEKGRVWKVDEAGLLHPVAIPGLVYPAGLALATDGRLFVADRDGAKVWVVDANGAASLFAGTTPGDTGDGGPATGARLTSPVAVALSAVGEVYIADMGAHRVRKVSLTGMIDTFAGTGAAGLGVGGPAVSAPLNAPEGVAVDTDGAVYIADTGNHRIVRVTPDGAFQPVSGGPDPGQPERLFLTAQTSGDLDGGAGCSLLYEPAGIAFDGRGNLYIPDRRNHRLRVLWKAASVPASAQPGDVNEDGVLNVLDAILTLRMVVQGIKATPCRQSLADVAPHPGEGTRPYGNGSVNTSDAIRLLRRGLGLIRDADWP